MFIILAWSMLTANSAFGSQLNGSRKYQIIKVPMTFQQAETYCQSDSGSSLFPVSQKADLRANFNELIEYWVKDPKTDHASTFCTVLKFSFAVNGWLTYSRDCSRANYFICRVSLPGITSTTVISSPTYAAISTTPVLSRTTAQPVSQMTNTASATTKASAPASALTSKPMQDFSAVNISISTTVPTSSPASFLTSTETQMPSLTISLASVSTYTLVNSPTIASAATLSVSPTKAHRESFSPTASSFSAKMESQTNYLECDGTQPFTCEKSTPSESVAHTSSHIFDSTGSVPLTTTPMSLNAYSSISIPHQNATLFVVYETLTHENASQSCKLSFSGSLAPSPIVLSVGSGLSNYLSSNQTYWLQEKKNSQCMTLYQSTKKNIPFWTTSFCNCTERLSFICKEEKLTVTTSRGTTSAPTSPMRPSDGRSKDWFTVGYLKFRLSRQSCVFRKAGQCCRDIGGTLTATLNSATLREVVKGLPQNGYDGSIWINGTSCFLNRQAKCDILTISNGRYHYSTADAWEDHFCLCQQPSYDRLPFRDFCQDWDVVGSFEYLKSGKPKTYKKAKDMCRNQGAELLDADKATIPFLLAALQLEYVDGTFWIRNGNGKTVPSQCVALKLEMGQYTKRNFSCPTLLYSICERPVKHTTPLATHLTPKPVWTRYKNHDYYVAGDHVSYTEAANRCENKLNGSLAFFTMATMYFEIAVALNLAPAQYWVGAGLKPSGIDSCLVLQVQHWSTSSLYATHCDNSYRSICRRPMKNGNVTFEPEFLKMLEEMAETAKATKTSMRKLTSATDNRKSAKAVGCVGLVVILFVSSIIIAFDVSNLKGCPKRRRRTLSSSTA